MIVGIDARAATEVSAGRGRVVRELLRSFADLPDDHRFVLYCRRPASGLKLGSRFRWEQIQARDPLWHIRTASAANRACGVFFSTNSYLTPWLTRIPTTVLVYDLIAFLPAARAQRRAKLIEHVSIGRAIRRASHVICISQATQRDLLERFPQAARKSTAVPLAASAAFGNRRSPEELTDVRRRYGLEQRFVLCTGTLEPRKNLPRLIEAYAGLPEKLRADHRLVLVGPEGWEMGETLSSVGAHAGDVRLLGYVPDDDLAALYRLCTVFCYPSLYEGFGLPVLEALQSGAPSITARVSSLPEVAGDAARYVDPLDVADIRAALSELLTSESKREVLRERGPRQAAKFTWERTARAVLDQVVGSAG